MTGREQREQIERGRDAAILREHKAISELRRLIARAVLNWDVGADKEGAYYIMRRELAEFLMERRPELFSWTDDFPGVPYFEGVPILFADGALPQQVLIAFDTWPLHREVAA